MSFLNVMIPVVTLTRLRNTICKQIDQDRLDVDYDESWPTLELNELIRILEQKVNVCIVLFPVNSTLNFRRLIG